MAVGLEERGCPGQNPLPEARLRIFAWRDLPGAPKLADLDNYLAKAHLIDASSNTWNRLADLFCPFLNFNAGDCYGDSFRNTVAQEIILSKFQPLACMSGSNWPRGQWLPDYADKQKWRDSIEPDRSQYVANQIANSQHIRLCVIYGKISKELRTHFCNLRGVQTLTVPRDNPNIGPLNEGKSILFVPHPGSWRFVPKNQPRPYTAKQFFTRLGHSLARQMQINPQ